MARPDFSLIWGSSRPSIPAISSGNYAAGWDAYLGPLPPLADDHDYVMNLQDKRANWLGGQMLKAVGHEWQSDITYDAYAITRSPVDGKLYRSLVGSNTGNEPSVSPSQWALGVTQGGTLDTLRINVASAATVNLTTSAPDTRHINITGTTTITQFTVAAGLTYFVRFDAALTLTNNANIVTQRGANITTAAGDTCIIRATAANVVEVLCGNFLVEAALGSRGQTWQNVTGSRAANTVYTNTTGRAIMVKIITIATWPGSRDLLVSGASVDYQSIASTWNGPLAQSAIVPPGATYQFGEAPAPFSQWMELR